MKLVRTMQLRLVAWARKNGTLVFFNMFPDEKDKQTAGLRILSDVAAHSWKNYRGFG